MLAVLLLSCGHEDRSWVRSLLPAWSYCSSQDTYVWMPQGPRTKHAYSTV